MNKLFLAEYVSTLKNMRGVIYFNPRELTEEGLKWIANKFKYRTVGVASALLEEVEEEKLKSKLSKRPFVLLSPPFPGLGEWIQAVAQLSGENFAAVESLILASAFVSPMLILGERALTDLSTFVIWQLQSTAELTDQEIKRHLRIADYAVLDFYQEMTQGAYEALGKMRSMQVDSLTKEEISSALINGRRAKAQSDGEKRFWRLSEKGEATEYTLVAYFDPLAIFPQLSTTEKEDLLKIFSSYSEEIILGLSIVVAFVLRI